MDAWQRPSVHVKSQEDLTRKSLADRNGGAKGDRRAVRPGFVGPHEMDVAGPRTHACLRKDIAQAHPAPNGIRDRLRAPRQLAGDRGNLEEFDAPVSSALEGGFDATP